MFSPNTYLLKNQACILSYDTVDLCLWTPADFGQQIGLSECFVKETLKFRTKCFLSLPRLSHQPVCPEVCFCQKHLHSQSITVGWRGPAASGVLTVRHVWGAKMWNGKWYSVTCLGFLCVKQPKCSYSHRSSGHTKGNLLRLSSGNALKWYSLSWG